MPWQLLVKDVPEEYHHDLDYLVDQLLKPGGRINFDDYHWSFANSPSVSTA